MIIKKDNRLSNLQLMTQQANCKKTANKRNYSFAANNHRNRSVKAINLSTKEETYYKSMYAAQQKLGINGGIIKMVYEGLNNCKIGISKRDGQRYSQI